MTGSVPPPFPFTFIDASEFVIFHRMSADTTLDETDGEIGYPARLTQPLLLGKALSLVSTSQADRYALFKWRYLPQYSSVQHCRLSRSYLSSWPNALGHDVEALTVRLKTQYELRFDLYQSGSTPTLRISDYAIAYYCESDHGSIIRYRRAGDLVDISSQHRNSTGTGLAFGAMMEGV
ncbi:uncharacterized protein ARMOST_20383 [Armillaria ostoyae]|uniref:Uncharacterized protein n=1 Tax=Armillaria ostoyae TaxID=47428 RepID=A0A284S778_ARMOS|nr:uncharacterized protein ARMOST_20383 [Armillaria ostoyae]